ncbi:MAG: hypothetical protein ACI4JK_12740 [Oscillospiraceae bacterium]
MVDISIIGTAVSKIVEVCEQIGPFIAQNKPLINNALRVIDQNGSSIVKESEIDPLKVIVKAIDIVTTLIDATSKTLGIENDDNICILGLKSQYAEKNPGDFPTWQDYISYLNNDAVLPDVVVDNLSETQRAGYQIAGGVFMIGALNEKYGFVNEFTFDMFVIAAKITVTVSEFTGIINGIVKEKLEPSAFVRYFSNDPSADFKETEQVQNIVVDALKGADHSMSEEAIFEKLSNMRNL